MYKLRIADNARLQVIDGISNLKEAKKERSKCIKQDGLIKAGFERVNIDPYTVKFNHVIYSSVLYTIQKY